MARSIMKQSYNSGANTLTRITVMGLTVLLLWGEVSRVEGGCSRYGHSCFGAHGKRADIPAAGYNSNLDPLAIITPLQSNQQASVGSPPMIAETIPDGYDPALALLSSNNRISPNLLEWILSTRRGDSRQVGNPSVDDISTTYRRK